MVSFAVVIFVEFKMSSNVLRSNKDKENLTSRRNVQVNRKINRGEGTTLRSGTRIFGEYVVV